jgi:hypothetical protein
MVVEPDGMGGVREVPRMLSAIDRLYGRFATMYMHKWSSHFTSPQLVADWKKAWSNTLISEGITFQMALEGIERCRDKYTDWAPTEGQFVALCRPAVDYEDAFNYAVREMRKRRTGEDSWPVPAVYWAAVDFGQYELRQASYSQAAARWKKLLDKRLKPGCPAVPPFVPQLPPPPLDADGKAMTSAEARAAAMKAMASLADKKPSRDIAIERARSILARHAAGEVMYVYHVEHARDVLARLEPNEPGDDPGTP